MSRIYEALQRADRERQAAPIEEGYRADETIPLGGLEDLPSLNGDFSFELIAQHPWCPSIDYFPALADRGLCVEQFRGLRSRIYQARYEAPLKTILISSGMPSEGKSFVSVNLAASLSRSGGSRTLLIDGDLRRPTLHNLLRTPNTLGLSEYLEGTAELNAIMQRQRSPEPAAASGVATLPNLVFIPAGKCSDISSELVANHRIEELIAAVSPFFDWILIDSPPALAVTDAVELAHASDAVLLVARGASTPFDAAQRTQSMFSKARILGFVLNDVKDLRRSSSPYSYYYGTPDAKGHADGQKGTRRKT